MNIYVSATAAVTMKIGGKLCPTKGLRMCAGEGGGEGGGEGLNGGNFPWGDGPAKGVGRQARCDTSATACSVRRCGISWY